MKYKILVGDTIEGAGRKLAQDLSNFGFSPECCTNNFNVFEKYLINCSYDGLLFFVLCVTDNMIRSIQQFRSTYPNLKIYPILTSETANFKQDLINAGASSCILMPCSNFSLCGNIIADFFTSDEIIILPEIADFLFSKRFPEHMLGFYSLCCAVETAIENPESLEKITSGLYTTVAKKMDSTYESVERALRVMLSSAFNQGVIINGNIVHRRIKNKELIRILADEYIAENGLR